MIIKNQSNISSFFFLVSISEKLIVVLKLIIVIEINILTLLSELPNSQLEDEDIFNPFKNVPYASVLHALFTESNGFHSALLVH